MCNRYRLTLRGILSCDDHGQQYELRMSWIGFMRHECDRLYQHSLIIILHTQDLRVLHYMVFTGYKRCGNGELE